MIMREAVSMKGKIIPRLNSLLKRGMVASTAIGKVLQDRYSNLTCRSDDQVHLSFVSPGDYEFSCSNSPEIPFYHMIVSKPRNRRGRHIKQVNIDGFKGLASPLMDKDAEEFIKRFYMELESQSQLIACHSLAI